MRDLLLFFCIIFPVLTGLVAYADKRNLHKRTLVYVTGVVLVVAALGLSFYAPTSVTLADSAIASVMQTPIIWLDFILLAAIIYLGVKYKHSLILLLGCIQFAGMVFLEVWLHPGMKETTPVFTIDSLAITLVLVVSCIGPVIARYALDYMKEHEEHLHLTTTRQPLFFGIILIFLGAMNGLALADNLSWVYFFWEVTTLCSFFLISHDQTDVAKANACTALWMNMAGGVAFVFALIYLQASCNTLSLTELGALKESGSVKHMAILLPVVALCFAGFTKSAQMPFQKWLCGAMVAPTPVSALLHSSTMVKAGVYLVLRLAPLYAGSSVSSMVALCGAFTFITTAALACGQSNGKKILAYSTISNLGLIVACAGINTQASIAAAMMLLIFHAISKGLLFLCVGAIEQRIGSRDIEDMRGLFKVMPKTALITVFGIVSMMLPPFGMLLAKWMALESAAEARMAMPFIVSMLALGSGLTVLFWARWAGVMLGSANPNLTIPAEDQTADLGGSLRTLAYMALGLSLFAPVLYVWLIEPAVASITGPAGLSYAATAAGIGNSYGLFAVYPVYLIIGFGFWYAWREAKKYSQTADNALPYMAGLQASQNGEVGFIGPMKEFVNPTASNYYLDFLFGETKLSKTANTVAIVLLVMLFGGVAQ